MVVAFDSHYDDTAEIINSEDFSKQREFIKEEFLFILYRINCLWRCVL